MGCDISIKQEEVKKAVRSFLNAPSQIEMWVEILYRKAEPFKRPTCTDFVDLTVTSNTPWWQVKDAVNGFCERIERRAVNGFLERIQRIEDELG
jgi:hypothetical protein